MDIKILHMVEGAKEACGIAVIIDVFRAFTVEAYLMHNHARRIIPVGDVQEAFRFREEDPEVILIGERGGAIIPGFQFGNSPSAVKPVDFTGRTVVHTTSAGTQGIANATHCDEILSGSLVNARAIADYILEKQPEHVSLVCMGLNAQSQTEEDNLCAEYIKSLLLGQPLTDLEAQIENLKVTSGAKFFDPAQQSVFPEPDFFLSTQVDQFPFVLRLTTDEKTGVRYMEKVDRDPEVVCC